MVLKREIEGIGGLSQEGKFWLTTRYGNCLLSNSEVTEIPRQAWPDSEKASETEQRQISRGLR
jgi:hypothetical protein